MHKCEKGSPKYDLKPYKEQEYRNEAIPPKAQNLQANRA